MLQNFKLRTQRSMSVGLRPVPSLWGSQGGCAPLTDACAPYLGLLKILFLEHYSVTRQHTMMEKAISTFKHNSPLTFSQFFCEIAGNQLLCHINLTQYSVLLTRFYGCVAKDRYKPAESLLVRDTFFSKTSCFDV